MRRSIVALRAPVPAEGRPEHRLRTVVLDFLLCVPPCTPWFGSAIARALPRIGGGGWGW